MRLGILALVLVLFAGATDNIRKARGQNGENTQGGQAATDRRKMFFGVIMLVVAVMVLIYYFATI